MNRKLFFYKFRYYQLLGFSPEQALDLIDMDKKPYYVTPAKHQNCNSVWKVKND